MIISPPDSPALIRGSALLAVYWTIGILTLAVFTTSQLVLFEVKNSGNEDLVFRAELLADSAVAIAANPETEPFDPLFERQLSDNESYRAVIRSEGGRINLNYMLNPERRIVLERLFESWGMESLAATAAVDGLIDWTDADDQTTGKGWEQRDYLKVDRKNAPFNRLLQNLDEASLAVGFDQVIASNPRWKEAFTLRSSGRLDLSDAPAELIAVVCDCTPETAVDFVQARNGADGIPWTEDDLDFQSIDEAFDLLRRGGQDRENLQDLVLVKDSVIRIVGTGRSGDVIVERSIIMQAGRGSQPVIFDTQTRTTFVQR